MGGVERSLVGDMEPTVRYHSGEARILTSTRNPGEGQFQVGSLTGGRLLKNNGGAQRFPQAGWKSAVECKGRRELDCETDKSSRVETRT